MADTPLIPGTPSPAPKGSVDGLTSPAVATPPPTPVAKQSVVAPKETQRAKSAVVMIFGTFYALYALWCFGLLSVFPTTDNTLRPFLPIGMMSALIGLLVFVAIGAFLFLRVTKADASVRTRQMSLMKVAMIVIPGILLSGAVPLLISREPPLSIDITEPTDTADLVAPVAVTFDLSKAADTLSKLNLKAIQYQWDTNGDGTQDDQTVAPTTTALFDRTGVYTVSAIINLEGGQSRRVSRQLIIPQAVFSIAPVRPIVERPVRFSVADLLTDPKLLKQVQWDFSADPGDEEVTTAPEVLHTYYATGKVAVSATVSLTNNTQIVYKRTVTIENPPPLPFPITLNSDPKNLVGPVPFGAIFTVQTDEPLKDIQWSFGDGKPDERGANLKRIGHSFEQPGIYPVTVRARNNDGKLAELTTLVRATDVLQLSDLKFTGTPDVVNNTVKGNVPLTLQLTPQTTVPLVQFSWDDPEGDGIVTNSSIEKTYRKQGTYTLTLIAQNTDGKAMRLPLTIQVDPPGTVPVINLKPDGGMAPLKVVFDASSTFIPPNQQIAGFEWTFGDEQPNTQPVLTAARTEHTYTTAGEYTVTLRVVMADGTDYKANRTIIVRRPVLSACFTASRTSVQAGKGVEFSSTCSTGAPSDYLWDVRSADAPDTPLAQGPQANYVYVFDTPGTYTVTLTLKDSFGSQDKKSVTITVTP